MYRGRPAAPGLPRGPGTLVAVNAARAAIVIAFVIVLGIPFAVRPPAGAGRTGADVLIVVTPHVQQIRYEFGAGFDRWYAAKTGRRAWIDWRTPGGGSEIVRQLEAQYSAAARSGLIASDGSCEPGAIGADVVFGGGTYDHGRLKSGVRVTVSGPDGKPMAARIPISVPAEFSVRQLDEWFGENRIGAQPLYDPDRYWLGTALSSFGIVYNRDVLGRLGLPEPRGFEDLADPRYAGWLSMADPRQSASVTTTFDSILNRYGWAEGWRILRSMGANARSWTNSSTKPPIDVSQGEAAAGLAIDFYGRSQAESVGDGRVGYVEPAGAVYVDADPVSILRGAPHPRLALLFVEFCLSEEGQALWQFAPQGIRSETPGAGAPSSASLGPERYALRRLPVRRVMYDRYMSRFTDRVNPFLVASSTPARGWRSLVGPMMGASAIDTADEQRRAWAAIQRAAAKVRHPTVEVDVMRRLFFSWPTTSLADGRTLEFNPENVGAVREAWSDPAAAARLRVEYVKYFRGTYDQVTAMAERYVRPP
jgi:iron(III) transport system substrate-binding protein